MEAKITEYLKSKHVVIPLQWVEEFINWFRQESASLLRPVTESELFKSAYEQWLVADLHELHTFCLPPNLTDKKKIALDGYFTLQVDSLRDISRPAYQQYLKLKGVNTSNLEVSADESFAQSKQENSANRLLRLEVTDGTQNIAAMEYQPLPFINLNMTPGTKILVFGKVMCRYGVLYLTKDNLHILGGDVEQLVLQNKPIKVLQRVLNKPDESETASDNSTIQQCMAVPIKEESVVSRTSAENSTVMVSSRPNIEISSGGPVLTNVNNENTVWNDMDDDDFVFDCDLDRIPNRNKRKSSAPCAGGMLPRKKNDLIVARLSGAAQRIPLVTVNKNCYSLETNGESFKQNLSDDIFDDSDDFTFEDIVMCQEKNLPSVEAANHSVITRPKTPFEYLCHLPTLPTTKKYSIRVKAFILTLLSAIDSNKGQKWQLKAEITDGSAKLAVEFADKVISGVIGMTASEYFTLKQLSKGNPEARKRRDVLMKQARQRLINLSCLMDLEILPGGTCATLINLCEVDQSTLNDLQSRVAT